VENYLSLLPEPAFSDKNFLFFNYDNFKIHNHVTKHTLDHYSVMRHYVSCMVDASIKRYNNENAIKFARFLVPDYSLLCKLANNAVEYIYNAREFGGFKNCLKNKDECLSKVGLTVLPSEIDRQTISYDDIVAIVRKLWDEYTKPLDMKVALFDGN